jgi:hypothetical protein
MLYEYTREFVDYHLYTECVNFTDGIIIDNSEFVVVDGEEGDYGIIKYFVGTDLVAIRTIYGGDDEDIEYTEIGKKWFKQQLMKAIEKCK